MLLLTVENPHVKSAVCMLAGNQTMQHTRNLQNDLAPFQIGALCRAEAKEFAESVVLVLPECGCQPPDTNVVCLRESCWRADRKPWRNVGGAYLGGCTARTQMRVASNV